MSQELVKATAPMSLEEMSKMADVFAKSGLFKDVATVAQAFVKIQAGKELGLAPFQAMSGMHIIAGKPVVGAGVVASAVKANPKYNYEVVEHTDKVCTIDFYEDGKKKGTSSFTLEDARKAGTKNMDKFPKNMLFARAISNGQKWFAPDCFSMAVYVPEEFDAQTEEGQATETKTVAPSQESVKATVIEPKQEKNVSQGTVAEKKEQVEPEQITGAWRAKNEKIRDFAGGLKLCTDYKESLVANPLTAEMIIKTTLSFATKVSECVELYQTLKPIFDKNDNLRVFLANKRDNCKNSTTNA